MGGESRVAIPSNRVNVSYLEFLKGKEVKKNEDRVAIPSNRVNVSYFSKRGEKETLSLSVAIPSNRVNVSYVVKKMKDGIEVEFESQSPQIGSMFLTSQVF